MAKSMFVSKVFRLLALGLVLLASVLLLIQYNYGSQHLVGIAAITETDEGDAEVELYASAQGSRRVISVSASSMLLRSIEEQDSEFLVVINQVGESLRFERIYTLLAPTTANLIGPRWATSRNMGFAIGSDPELVEMIGLDEYGYQLSQPRWAQNKVPDASMVYQREGQMDAAKEILDGDSDEFAPDVYILDQGRVVGMRQIDGSLLTLPELMRRGALVMFAVALLPAILAFVFYKWEQLSRLVRAIWDQVSMRGRSASN